MQQKSGKLILSATDLGNHLGCTHLTWLDKQLAEGNLQATYRDDLVLDLLIERGLLHERRDKKPVAYSATTGTR